MNRGFVMLLLMLPQMLPAEVPVRRVVLYKNGVAWVERSGELQASEAATLNFSAEEMNDVLKSLVVESRGGVVARVRYDGAVPLTDKLGIAPGVPLAKLLDSFRGARLALTVRGENVEGRIVSGRAAAGADKSEQQELTLLLAGGEVRRIDLEGVSAIRILEPRLQQQLDESLTAWSQVRAKERKTVTIDAPGATALTARYLIPFPSWKSSYRLSLPESGEPTLEGWAIVDNASLEDWNSVQLTVVSGKPVSFISRLYEPRYVQREQADVPDATPAAPKTHERAMRRLQSLGGVEERMSTPAPMAMDMAASMAAPEVNTEAAEAGELFEYRFTEPVNVGRGNSVLLPFVRQKLTARRLLVYSGGLHPRAAAEFTNTTGKTLDGGPITVYEAGGYAGEAMMSTTKQGDKRLLSFAEDLGVSVTTNFDSGSRVVTSVRANRGLIISRSSVQTTTTYTVSNTDAKAKTLLIEHPVRAEQKLVSPAAAETTTQHYRFSLNLAPESTATLPVVEQRELQEQTLVTSWAAQAIEVALTNWKLSASARKQLEGLLEKKRAVAQADKDLKQMQAEISERNADQGRIRENLTAVARVPNQQEQVQRYTAELTRLDAAISALQAKQADLRRQKAELERELNELSEKISF